MSRTQDEKYMRRAIDLAKAGEGWVHPNPLVGAVIVKDGSIIGEGYHRRYGQLHAERNAIADAKHRAGDSAAEALDGATIYVTLEPCCHYGKTPPCTEAIMENGIRRVVIGSRDPNPLVAGKGAQILRDAGIEVEEDFLRQDCDELNPVFFHYIRTKLPYVIMKYAMTADGKIATKTGASKWITGEEARQEVHRIRHACMGIMAGIGTVLADDPLLNCRLEGFDARQPIRIICDSRLRIPMDSQICRTAGEYETIVVCADPLLPAGEQKEEQAPGPAMREMPELEQRGPLAAELEQHGPLAAELEHGPLAADLPAFPDQLQEAPKQLAGKIRLLRRAGITVINAPARSGAPGAGEAASRQVDLKMLMNLLGARSIDSILLEGGSTLNESALQAGIVSEVRAFIAPKLFGGKAKSPVEGIGVEVPDQAVPMELIETEMFGGDLMLRYLVKEK